MIKVESPRRQSLHEQLLAQYSVWGTDIIFPGRDGKRSDHRLVDYPFAG